MTRDDQVLGWWFPNPLIACAMSDLWDLRDLGWRHWEPGFSLSSMQSCNEQLFKDANTELDVSCTAGRSWWWALSLSPRRQTAILRAKWHRQRERALHQTDWRGTWDFFSKGGTFFVLTEQPKCWYFHFLSNNDLCFPVCILLCFTMKTRKLI